MVKSELWAQFLHIFATFCAHPNKPKLVLSFLFGKRITFLLINNAEITAH